MTIFDFTINHRYYWLQLFPRLRLSWDWNYPMLRVNLGPLLFWSDNTQGGG